MDDSSLYLPPIPARAPSVWSRGPAGVVEPSKPVEQDKEPPNAIHTTSPESLSTTSLNTDSPSKLATQKELPPWASLPLDECMEFYAEALREAAAGGQAEYDSKRRLLAENDLFYLLVFICERKDLIHPWLYARCREVQANPDGYLDLWSREHGKSSLITFGLTIFDIINDPEVTIGIFSHTKPIAKGFLRQIKYEFESRPVFHELWPDIFWEKPQKESPKWSEDEGITVKRQGNPKEATVEAWGLVDGQPTGKHYKKRVYDDVVTDKSVYTPEQIKRTTSAWELSDNLGTKNGVERYIGTRYHLFDTYAEMMKRGVVKPRLYPATKDGMETGEPVLLTREALAEKRAKQGPYTFSSQMLQNPVSDSAMGFKDAWLVYEQFTMAAAMTALNRIIVVDPAGSKQRKNNDYTTMWVLGLGSDSRWRVLEFIRDRLNLTQRAAALIALHKRWKPIKVGYEEYGMQADIEHIKSVQVSSLYQFGITPLGGQMSKHNRIMRLVPYFENGNIILPPTMVYKDYQGIVHDLVRVFREEEYIAYPVPNHDDMLDGLSRLCDDAMRIDPPIENNTLVSQGLNLEDALRQASIQIGMTGTSSIGALDMGSSWMGA